MFNNFTSGKEYESCNVVLHAEAQRGSLLIGDFNSATDSDLHRQHNIKTIITSAAGLEHLEIPPSITHIVYPLKDAKSENIQSYFNQSFETIDRSKQKLYTELNEGGVLVHCAAGISRSATIIIAYLMRKDKMTFKAAINLVRNKRNGVCPNLGFELQLKKFQSELIIPTPKPTIKNNISEINNDARKNKEAVKLGNHSFFQFDKKKDFMHVTQNRDMAQKMERTHKKGESKKIVPSKMIGFSRPKEKQIFEVGETNLFVSGRRPNSQVREHKSDKFQAAKKNPMLGTWGPLHQRHKINY